MIAIANEQGGLIKWVNWDSAQSPSQELGFHKRFGFMGPDSTQRRGRARAMNQGVRTDSDSWLFRFRIEKDAQNWKISALENCAVELADSGWELLTNIGRFRLQAASQAGAAPELFAPVAVPQQGDDRKIWGAVALAFLLFLMVSWFGPKGDSELAPAVILEPVNVKIVQEKQKAVRVPSTDSLPRAIATQNQQARKAIAQDLGFLGMLGKKNLTKALGGAPTSIAQASAGAGAGGTAGSGGELLSGLGQGVKRTTVGNSGTVGLGGVGTKGAGGGNGGYGNTSVGSGGGRALSSMPVSQDIVLDGGLDRSVIQATIAKYLSQVRACYEEGLRGNAGLSGTVTMQFEVGSLGALNSARVGKSSLGNADVEGCIAHKMMTWKFPKPLGGVNVKVAYPFLLRPANG